MANTICIMGESGSGKTTSLRNLDPAQTVIIDCDGKGLAWRGWKTQYSHDKKNYFVGEWTNEKGRTQKATDKNTVLSILEYVNNSMFDVHYVVVDTLNAIMLADERGRKDEKGYDKWADLAWAVFDILDYGNKMRDDITVIFTAHTQTERDDDGYKFTRIKTSGKKLDKIQPESKIRTVLNSKRVDGEYILEARNDTSTAKDGMGGELPEHMPNDIVEVIEKLREYDGEPINQAVSKTSKKANNGARKS